MHKIFSNIIVGNTPSVLSTDVFYLDNIGSISKIVFMVGMSNAYV